MSLLRSLLKKDNLIDRLFKIIDDYNIYKYFIGFDVELGETINSPIRLTDDYPSFATAIYRKCL